MSPRRKAGTRQAGEPSSPAANATPSAQPSSTAKYQTQVAARASQAGVFAEATLLLRAAVQARKSA